MHGSEGEEENSKQQETLALGKWPWDYLKYDTSNTALRELEGARKFHDLMWDMQKNYEAKIWQFLRKRKVGFTYRFEFKRKTD